MNLPEILQSLSTEVSEQIIKAVEEARDIRALIHAGNMQSDLIDIHEFLVKNRAGIERLEALVSQFTLLKSRTAQALASRQGEYDDAYMQSATKPTIGFGDYASAKEKDAYAGLGAMEESIQLRKATALHRDVESAWDYCRILLRGAEATQRDLETRIRLITLTSNLER